MKQKKQNVKTKQTSKELIEEMFMTAFYSIMVLMSFVTFTIGYFIIRFYQDPQLKTQFLGVLLLFYALFTGMDWTLHFVEYIKKQIIKK